MRKVHLRNRIFLFKVGIGAGVICVIALAVLFSWNGNTIKDAERWSNQTDLVLDDLSKVEAAIKKADHLGKVPLIQEHAEEVAEARTRAVQLIERFRARVGDNTDQVAHTDTLRDRFSARIAAQNKQAAQSRLVDDDIVFKRVNVIDAIDTSFNLEESIAQIRNTERILHHNRDAVRSSLKWRLIYGMVLCSILFFVAIGVTLNALWEELQSTKRTAKSLETAIHKSEADGSHGLTENQANALLRQLTEGAEKIQQFKMFLVG